MKIFSITVNLFIICLTGFSQDPHFSQYYASQATINPATTGAFEGDARVSGLHRQQWAQYGNAFISSAIAFELKPGKLMGSENRNTLAVGGMVLYDKTPDEVLKSQYAYAMIAYHKALDENGNNKLGIGCMVGYNQRTLDVSRLTFGNQFVSGGFNTDMEREAIAFHKLSYVDLHAGFLYSYQDEERLFYAGASVFHLMNPNNSFMGSTGGAGRIEKRWNAHGGLNIQTDHFHYAASLLMMRQGNRNEMLIGGMVGMPFSENGILFGGGWFRVTESLIPTVNLQWGNVNVGLSYDAFVNSRKTFVCPRTLELSLVYSFLKYNNTKTGCYAF